MQVRLTREFMQSPGRYRHVFRFEGSHDDIEALLNHVVDGEGYWCSDEEFANAIAYVCDGPAVLEFEPQFYVPASFQDLPFVVTRGEKRATIVVDDAAAHLRLARLTMTFHPDVSLEARVTEQGRSRVWTALFRDGELVDGWCDSEAAHIAGDDLPGLTDPEWHPTTGRRERSFRDVLFPTERRTAGSIRVRGSVGDVKSFRAAFLRSIDHEFESEDDDVLPARMTDLQPNTGCHLEDYADDDLLVRFRRAQGLASCARRWSVAFPELECDVVITNRSRLRTHVRFVNGHELASAAIEVDESEFEEAFQDRRHRRDIRDGAER